MLLKVDRNRFVMGQSVRSLRRSAANESDCGTGVTFVWLIMKKEIKLEFFHANMNIMPLVLINVLKKLMGIFSYCYFSGYMFGSAI
ncbi:hypothetical protein HanRHA438_Chr06g0253111 [Helianthus annuus]|nr:hypothetical protein HanRHA438_Chr06g0253111 [Helianthus annuus]